VKTYKTLPSGIKIVEYEESLAPAIADMWNRSGEGWGGRFGDGIWTRETAIAQQESQAFFNVYIALDGEEVVGYCSLMRYWKDENTAYVQLLSVRPDCHGKGIGKEFILLCVERTIELGMPRLDLHTWPGNTKAMPMYKKCGFMWEDRSDTTLLSNFIPTILSTELLQDFFKKADWYADSTRKIDIEVDGVKKDKFELYEYKWKKDEQYLTLGFEKSGRRIRLIDTENYRVELTATDHEAAFGAAYPCVFEITNKKNTPLDVKIKAKRDKPVCFDGTWGLTVGVKGKEIINAEFFVDKIDKVFDPMRVHPAVLADVYIDGKHAEFGLGIEPKFPIEVSIKEKRQLAKPGSRETHYINIKNNLSKDATVSFTLPENKLTRFETTKIEGKLKKGKDLMLKTEADVLSCGYEKAIVEYEIQYSDTGEKISFEKPLHLVNQGLTGSFYYETDKEYGAVNGTWRLAMVKKDNEVVFDSLTGKGHSEFIVSKLGMPLEDEFDTAEPAAVRAVNNGSFIRFEADFVSKKFSGAKLTEIYEFDSAGILKRSHSIENTGKKPLDLTLQSVFWSSIGKRPVFHYDGDIHEGKDAMIYGFDSISFEKLDENWVFDTYCESPAGLCWPKEYTPKVSWGDEFTFTFPAGEIGAGKSFQSEPIVFMFGVFRSFHEFRNYVLGEHNETIPFAKNHLELIVNEKNPVISQDAVTLALKSNRQKPWEGTVGLSSKDGLFESVELAWQFDEDDEDEDENDDTIPLYRLVSAEVTTSREKAGLSEVAFSLNLSGREKEISRAVMITDDTKISCKQADDVFTVTNGKISFSASPKFIDTVHSLKYDDREWLLSGFPELKPLSWYNPFIGGIKTSISRLGNRLTLREKITAEFTTETDVLGNVWTGIRMDVEISKHDEFKGLSYSQYYLTLPGVPVLCHFLKLNNGTGRYLEAEMYAHVFIADKNTRKNTVAEMTGMDGQKHRMRFGGEEDDMSYDRLISIERDGKEARPEKLYVLKDSGRDNGRNGVEYDLDTGATEHEINAKVPDGEVFTTKPVLCLLSEKTLTMESVEDFSRIEF